MLQLGLEVDRLGDPEGQGVPSQFPDRWPHEEFEGDHRTDRIPRQADRGDAVKHFESDRRA